MKHPRFSANLGFLWTDRSLPDAIRAAGEAGFDAVECHFPYKEDADAVAAALKETGLPMLGLNTTPGAEPGDRGLAAVPGRETEARRAIEEAVSYGRHIGARAVHVMAGTQAVTAASTALYRQHLGLACDLAAEAGMTVLIEPLNPRDAPGYFLASLEQAVATVEAVARPELKIMFDCYHLQILGGDLITRFRNHRDIIGHIQFAAVPSRAEPDEGEVAYEHLLPAFLDAGYAGDFGAEYVPRRSTGDGLGWLNEFRRACGAAT